MNREEALEWINHELDKWIEINERQVRQYKRICSTIPRDPEFHVQDLQEIKKYVNENLK